MSEEYDTLGWYKDTIKRMSWDEIQELMQERIANGSWDNFVKTLGKAPHVIKHDHFIEEMNKKKEEKKEEKPVYVNTGHGLPL